MNVISEGVVKNDVENLKMRIHEEKSVAVRYYLKGRLDALLWLTGGSGSYNVIKSDKEIVDKIKELVDELRWYNKKMSVRQRNVKMSSDKKTKRIMWIDGFVDVLILVVDKNYKESE